MTLTTSTNVVTYDGDGSNTTFDFSFQLFSESDLTVIRTDAGGNETTVSTSDYSVSPASGTDYDNGGTVTYPTSGSPLPSGEKLTLIREVPYTQTTSLRNQSAYFPESVETAMDRLAAQIQQNNERLGRAVKLPVVESVELTLPAPNADRVIGYNSAGTDLEAKVVNDGTYLEVPDATTQTAFVRWDDTDAQGFLNSQTTEDANGNVAVQGDLELTTQTQATIAVDPDSAVSGSLLALSVDGTVYGLIDENGNVTLGDDTTPDRALRLSLPDAIKIPAGTTAERPSSPVAGDIRWNEDNNQYEGYNDNSGEWGPLGGAGLYKGENGERGDTANGAGDIFRVHENTLNTDVTIEAGENAVAAGPLTVASGVTLTVNGNLSVV